MRVVDRRGMVTAIVDDESREPKPHEIMRELVARGIVPAGAVYGHFSLSRNIDGDYVVRLSWILRQVSGE